MPLEADLLNGVQGVDVIRSESVPGLSSIVLVFEPGTDIYHARQLVQERLTQARALPNVSQAPTLLQPLSSSSRVLMTALSSRQLSSIDQSVIARWTVKPRLMDVPGVANISVWGMRDQQIQVQDDPHPATFIEKATSNITLVLIIGGALMALGLAALLFQWQTVLLALVAIPLSLVAAALVLDPLGETFNAISFAGLAVAVAVVIDDAVAGAQNVPRRVRARPRSRGTAWNHHQLPGQRGRWRPRPPQPRGGIGGGHASHH